MEREMELANISSNLHKRAAMSHMPSVSYENLKSIKDYHRKQASMYQQSAEKMRPVINTLNIIYKDQQEVLHHLKACQEIVEMSKSIKSIIKNNKLKKVHKNANKILKRLDKQEDFGNAVEDIFNSVLDRAFFVDDDEELQEKTTEASGVNNETNNNLENKGLQIQEELPELPSVPEE